MIETRSDMAVTLIDSLGDDTTIAAAARVSTRGAQDAQNGAVEGLVRRLWNDGHVSCFEHCVVTLAVECPIFIARQMMRHRSISFNETSGRYSTLKPVFYLPPADAPLTQTGKPMDYRRGQMQEGDYEYLTRWMQDAYRKAWDTYTEAINVGMSREEARIVLPTAVYTSFYATANLRDWLFFLKARLDPHAQYEIRQVAEQIRDYLRTLYPITMTAWEAA